MELKTLKELKMDKAQFCVCGSNAGTPCMVCDSTFQLPNVVGLEDLKQELIKWVKALHDWDLHLIDHGLPKEWLSPLCKGEFKIEDLIKYVFNITEEDLK